MMSATVAPPERRSVWSYLRRGAVRGALIVGGVPYVLAVTVALAGVVAVAVTGGAGVGQVAERAAAAYLYGALIFAWGAAAGIVVGAVAGLISWGTAMLWYRGRRRTTDPACHADR